MWKLLRMALLIPCAAWAVWSVWEQRDRLLSFLSSAGLLVLAAAGGLLALTQLCFAVRQGVLLCREQEKGDLRLLLRVTFAGLFANNFLPAGAGYDLARLCYLREFGDGRSLADVTGLIVLDRLAALSALAVLSCLALAALFAADVHALGAGRLIWPSVAASLLLPTAIVALRAEWLFSGLARLGARLPFSGPLGHLLESLRGYVGDVRRLPRVFALAVAGHLCAIVGIALIALFLFGPAAGWTSLATTPLVLFVSSIPVTPANLGWTESVADVLWRMSGVEGGAVVFVVWRTVLLAVSLAGGGCHASLTLGAQPGKG